jgi:hypothetical protein
VEKFRNENDVFVDHLCISFPWMDERQPDSSKKKKNSSSNVDDDGNDVTEGISEESLNDIQNALQLAANPPSLSGACVCVIRIMFITTRCRSGSRERDRCETVRFEEQT